MEKAQWASVRSPLQTATRIDRAVVCDACAVNFLDLRLYMRVYLPLFRLILVMHANRFQVPVAEICHTYFIVNFANTF